MAEQNEPVEVISLEQYQTARRTGKVLGPKTLVLVPVAELEIVEDAVPALPVVYQHLLYFASKSLAEAAKQTLMTRRPRVVSFKSFEVRDLDGDPVLELLTEEELDVAERMFVRRAVRPAFEKFNVEGVVESPRTPGEILAQTKRAYHLELQETLAVLQELAQDPEVNEIDFCSPRDDQTRIGVCLALIEELLADPTQQTAQALEERLRTLFRRVDEIEAALQSLPDLDDMDDEDLVGLDAETRVACEQARKLEHECYELDCQIALTARFLGVPTWLIRRMRLVMSVSREDEETKRTCQYEEAANAYPLVQLWMNGTGTIKELVMPDCVALWDEENISLVG